MVNTKAIKDCISSKGIKLQFVADKIGIDRKSLYLKLNGESEFRASEMETLSDLLELTPKQRNAIFFAKEGE